MTQLEGVAEEDIRVLQEKERTYGGSWKKRGGAGAFMMLARKWDRIENIAEAAGWDIFEVIQGQGMGGADGELLAEIRDLRRYLMLVEAEMKVQLTPSLMVTGGGGGGGAPRDALGREVQRTRSTEQQNPFGYVEDEEV